MAQKTCDQEEIIKLSAQYKIRYYHKLRWVDLLQLETHQIFWQGVGYAAILVCVWLSVSYNVRLKHLGELQHYRKTYITDIS